MLKMAEIFSAAGHISAYWHSLTLIFSHSIYHLRLALSATIKLTLNRQLTMTQIHVSILSRLVYSLF